MHKHYLILIALICLTPPVTNNAHAKQTAYAISVSETARFKQQSEELLTLLLEKNFIDLQEKMEIEALKPTLPSNGKDRIISHVDTWWDDLKANKALFPYLDEWVAAYPQSHIPLTARGISRYKQAYIERGKGFADTVSKEQFKKMYDHLKIARKDLEQAVNLQPNNPAAWETLIYMSVFFADDKKSAAKRYFRRALKHVPTYYYIYTGFQKNLKPRWGGREGEMKKFLVEYSQTDDVMSRMPALILEAIMDQADMLDRNDRAIEEHYTDAPLKKFFTKKIYGTRKEQDFYKDPKKWAIFSYILEKISTNNPQLVSNMTVYADLALKGDHTDIAEQTYRKIIAVDPGYTPYSLINLGHIHQERKQYEEALEYYKTAHKIFPEHRRTLGKLGYTYTLLNRWPESVETYKIYTALYPEKNGWANLCSSLARVQKYEEAHAACDKSIAVAPTDPWALHLKGWVYTWQGNKKLGQNYIQKAKTMGWGGY